MLPFFKNNGSPGLAAGDFGFRAGIRNQAGDITGAGNDLTASASLLDKEKRKRKLEKVEEDMLSAILKQLNRN